jgi:hypothetical protein
MIEGGQKPDEVVQICSTCQFPDGEPILHTISPGSCDRVQIDLRSQEYADDLRRAYYRSRFPDEDIAAWRTLSKEVKDAWIAVLYRAEEFYSD